MKQYQGRRTSIGCEVTVFEDSGEPRPLDPRFDLRRQSPDGFEWGYAGSGPAQLSPALLADALDDELAQEDYPRIAFAEIITVFEASDPPTHAARVELHPVKHVTAERSTGESYAPRPNNR